ncbi:hypothetical protein M3Y98_00541400 [Aphelenchoides besseyi]|nr:hypothetical protein M3Y98_00541400 [Aphelenchoides besseyi]KAI6208139.1 hypothetical protein M3Y96_00083200 [Aphelenchoides besseyi]
MFYACLSVFLLFGLLCFCISIAIIDIDLYNCFLYVALLCIVGTMLACALCIANPQACANPKWWTVMCIQLQEMYPVPATTDGTSSPKMTGLRSRMMAMQSASIAQQNSANANDKFPLRNESRSTVAMLGPALAVFHSVWKGMEWVADGIEEEEDEMTRSADIVEQGISTSDTSEPMIMKRLSTVVENEREEISTSYASIHDDDVMLLNDNRLQKNMSSAFYGRSSADEQLISNSAEGLQTDEGVYCNPTTSNTTGRCVELALPSRAVPSNDMRFSTLSDCSSYYGIPESANENQSRHVLHNPYLRANLRVVIGSILLTLFGAVFISFGLFVTLIPNELDVHGWIFLVVGVLFFIPGAYHLMFIICTLSGRKGWSFDNLPTFSRPTY